MLISIPLSILTSITVLSALGYTINVMTLGGLALAIGILVDDATVEIENIHRNLAMGKPLQQAILDGAQQIATPAFVATLSICIVFIPVVLLEGPAKFLFVPFALAVVFAVFTSYILSRTIVPVLVKYLLANETHAPENATPTSFFGRVHHGFNDGFERFRSLYVNVLAWALGHRLAVLAAFAHHASAAPSSRCRGSAAISSRRSMPARSACTSSRPAARASRRRRRSSPRWKRRSARPFPPRTWR